MSSNGRNPMSSGDARIVVLSGPSGSGKSTIVNRLIERAPVKLTKAVSATTRPPRAGEVDGEDYYFLNPSEFEKKRASGEFVECAEVFGAGYWYGTLKSELERIAATGGWALLEIDVQGALDVMQKYPEAVTIFLTAASERDYEQRLRRRGTESESTIQQRLHTAREELKMVDRYKHCVVNDDLDRAVEEISNILLSEAKLHA